MQHTEEQPIKLDSAEQLILLEGRVFRANSKIPIGQAAPPGISMESIKRHKFKDESVKKARQVTLADGRLNHSDNDRIWVLSWRMPNMKTRSHLL